MVLSAAVTTPSPFTSRNLNTPALVYVFPKAFGADAASASSLMTPSTIYPKKLAIGKPAFVTDIAGKRVPNPNTVALGSLFNLTTLFLYIEYMAPTE